ncbi:MAG TPA: hypothetical protein VIX39_09855 [Actinomycetota bacterium]
MGPQDIERFEPEALRSRLRADLEEVQRRATSGQVGDGAAAARNHRQDQLRLRHALEALTMMEEVQDLLGPGVEALQVSEEYNDAATEFQFVFRLLPASPRAAPVALRITNGDEVLVEPGHGVVIHWNTEIESVAAFVKTLRFYVRLVTEGAFREVYWPDRPMTAGGAVKTYFLIGGRWRRQGKIGGGRGGRRIERRYEPYRTEPEPQPPLEP